MTLAVAAVTATSHTEGSDTGRSHDTYTKKNRVQTCSVFGTTHISPCLCRSGEVITVGDKSR